MLPPREIDSAERAEARRRNRNNFAVLVAVMFCVLGLLGLGGHALLTQFDEVVWGTGKNETPSTLRPVKQPAVAGSLQPAKGESKSNGHSDRVSKADVEKHAIEDRIKYLALKEMRQYVVNNNEKAGRMIVIEGRVANNFKTPKEWIKLEVALYDKRGKTLAVQEQYCGIMLSVFELQILSKMELENALTDKAAMLKNNTDIRPGQSVPFITIFFMSSDAVYEYGVKIVDVKDLAPKQ